MRNRLTRIAGLCAAMAVLATACSSDSARPRGDSLPSGSTGVSTATTLAPETADSPVTATTAAVQSADDERVDSPSPTSEPMPSATTLPSASGTRHGDLQIVVPDSASAEVSSDEAGFSIYRIEVAAEWQPLGLEPLPECWAAAETPDGKTLTTERNVTAGDTGAVIVLDTSVRPGQSVPKSVTVTCVHRDTNQHAHAVTDIEWITPGFCPSYETCPGDGATTALPESNEPTISGNPGQSEESDAADEPAESTETEDEAEEPADESEETFGWPPECTFRHEVVTNHSLWSEITRGHSDGTGFRGIAKAMSAEQWADYVALTHSVGEGLDALVDTGCIEHERSEKDREILHEEQDNFIPIRLWMLDYAAAAAGHYCAGAAERDGVC